MTRAAIGLTALWAALALWTALVVTRAATELTATETVTGLTRTWAPPHDSPIGHVLDPRPIPSLLAELRDRYAPDAPAPRGDPTVWAPALAALGLDAAPYTGDAWPGTPPRLRLPAPGDAAPPHLLIGTIGLDPVVVWPGLGVVRVPRDRLPPASVDLALRGAREAPW